MTALFLLLGMLSAPGGPRVPKQISTAISLSSTHSGWISGNWRSFMVDMFHQPSSLPAHMLHFSRTAKMGACLSYRGPNLPKSFHMHRRRHRATFYRMHTLLVLSRGSGSQFQLLRVRGESGAISKWNNLRSVGIAAPKGWSQTFSRWNFSSSLVWSEGNFRSALNYSSSQATTSLESTFRIPSFFRLVLCV